MTKTCQIMKAYVEAKDIKGIDFYDERDCCIVRASVHGNVSIRAYIIFDEGDASLRIRVFDYCKFTEDKKAQMYKLCSQMNGRFRWVKFYVDEEDCTITLEDDAIVALDSCAEEALALVEFVFGIADEAYPDFMKVIWA